MRGKLWLAGLVLWLCGGRPAWAQSANLWGQPPGPIVNQVIDPTAFALPAAGSLPAASSTLNALASLFPSFGHSPKKPPKWPFWMGRKKRRVRQLQAVQRLTSR
jgi:hypothetical protein